MQQIDAQVVVSANAVGGVSAAVAADDAAVSCTAVRPLLLLLPCYRCRCCCCCC
jgi:hypothetical protein